MNIRTKLTVTFFCLVIIVLTTICVSIYFFSANYRKQDFYRRLKNRASNTAKVLTQVKEVDAGLLRKIEQDNPASLPNQYVIILNYKNDTLYRSKDAVVLPIDSTLLNNIRLTNEVHYIYQGLEVLGFLFVDKYDRFTVIAAATDIYGLDALRNLRNVLIITFSVSTLLISLLGWLYAGKVLSPISRIVNDVSNITAVNLNRRLDEGNGNDELGKLAQTFNHMLVRLQRSFSSQKNFIANASHEIKTPITVMSGQIEVALQLDRDKEYYRSVLRKVLGGLGGLNALSTQLLLLAQTSADQQERSFTAIRIDDILWETKEELSRTFPHYVIDIHFNLSVNHEFLVIDGDEQLIKVAVLNLMDNGCKFADNHRVSIELSKGEKNSVLLKFTNTGKIIEPENLHKIFDPFFRGRNQYKVRGFGIGLSLVGQITNLHDGSLNVDSTPQRTVFTLFLPVKRSEF